MIMEEEWDHKTHQLWSSKTKSNIIEKLKDLQPIRPVRPNIWCTHYLVEGHVVTECLMLRGTNSSGGIVGSSRAPPIVGFMAVGS